MDPAPVSIGDRLAGLPFQARAALFLALGFTLTTLHFVHAQEARQIFDESPVVASSEVLYVPDTRVSRLTMLGYDQAAADLTWLRTLGYFGRHFTTDRRYQWLEFLIDQIIELDPRFQKVYHWAGANVLYGRRFTNANVLRSNHFYEAALARFPDDYEAAYRLGLNHYIELRSDDPEERRRYKEQGLAHLEMAANMPGAPQRMRNLVASIAHKLGHEHITTQYLLELLAQEQDPQRKEELLHRIKAAAAAVDIDELRTAAETYQRSRDTTFPYLPDDLYVVLGEPQSRRWPERGWRELIPDIQVQDGGAR